MTSNLNNRRIAVNPLLSLLFLGGCAFDSSFSLVNTESRYQDDTAGTLDSAEEPDTGDSAEPGIDINDSIDGGIYSSSNNTLYLFTLNAERILVYNEYPWITTNEIMPPFNINAPHFDLTQVLSDQLILATISTLVDPEIIFHTFDLAMRQWNETYRMSLAVDEIYLGMKVANNSLYIVTTQKQDLIEETAYDDRTEQKYNYLVKLYQIDLSAQTANLVNTSTVATINFVVVVDENVDTAPFYLFKSDDTYIGLGINESITETAQINRFYIFDVLQPDNGWLVLANSTMEALNLITLDSSVDYINADQQYVMYTDPATTDYQHLMGSRVWTEANPYGWPAYRSTDIDSISAYPGSAIGIRTWYDDSADSSRGYMYIWTGTEMIIFDHYEDVNGQQQPFPLYSQVELWE